MNRTPIAVGIDLGTTYSVIARLDNLGRPITLVNADARLLTMLPERIIVQPFSWRWYFDTARQCKLYDFTRQCWTDYKGRATSQPPAGLPA